MGFRTEKELTKSALLSPYFQDLLYTYPEASCIFEAKGLFGIPDVLVIRHYDAGDDDTYLETVAFEMKLSNWQRALIQAFKYRSFAQQSYVVIDKSKERPAVRNLDKFIRSNIGLISVDQNGGIHVHHHPVFKDPYSPHMSSRVKNILYSALSDTPSLGL